MATSGRDSEMTALLGRIDEFDSKTEEWEQYEQRLKHYFTANDVESEVKKKSTLITVVGKENFKLMRSLIHPTDPNDKTYDELVAVMKQHFEPQPSEIVQRFKFHTRSRKQGETVALFVSELRSIAKDCNFGNREQLELMLRDRIVCGIANEKIQAKLLSEKNLTYKTAMSLAQSIEIADRNVKELQGYPEKPGGTVNQVEDETSHKKPSGPCYRCGKEGHAPTACRFWNATCHGCGKVGHLKAVCRKGNKKKPGQRKPFEKSRKPGKKRVYHLEGEESTSEESADEYPLHHITASVQAGSRRSPPLQVELLVDEKPITMELDTGAAYTLVNETTFKQLWPKKELKPSHLRLTTYSGEEIPVVGSREVSVHYGSQVSDMSLIVVKGKGPSLLGRNWLKEIRLDWQAIHMVGDAPLEEVLNRHQTIFQEGLGTLKGFQAKISVDPNAVPKYCRARSVPYSMRDKVEAELDRLVQEGTLEPVQTSDWASPIVAVLKPNGKVRLCGDFKQTVNPVSKLDRYPIPRVEDLFAKLAGGKKFSHLDLSQAYQQLPLDNNSKQYVVINTQKGLFRFNRLPYGISSAPGIFQREMENLLQGIPGVVVYIDDIGITGETDEAHLKALDEVLNRLEKAGLRLQRAKCHFMQLSIIFLGHKVDAAGLHPLREKVQAIRKAPAPTSVTELKSYIGLLSYYSKFLPNMATVLGPLYQLLRKGVDWRWRGKEEKAFEASKELILSTNLLVHFDPSLPILLACDASSYGVGAVLAHRMPDGTERPVGFASRTLNPAEKNYAQIEREGLACVFGIKRFRTYLFGHSFELITDHKPLLALLNQHKATSEQASARIRRWALFMSSYEYQIQFRKTEQHGNADALSRLPLPKQPAKVPVAEELVLLVQHLDDSPVTARQVESATRKDPTMSQVLQFVRQGWPDSCREKSLQPYTQRKNELSVHEGCVLWGSRVILPRSVRSAVLAELHQGHPGMSRMKSLARMYVWWPGLEKDIEAEVSACRSCQMSQAAPPVAPLHPWAWPSRPWARIHLDFAGPLEGSKMLLILVDAHSKWIEVFPTNHSTSAVVIESLRKVFAQFGLPETVVSDNGSCFVSEEFNAFLLDNGVKQILSSPYHPASNGLAERAVQTVKRGLKKDDKGSLDARLARILMSYRLTPQSTTGVSPAELLLGRQPRSRLDLLKPNTADHVEARQSRQKKAHDASSRVRTFQMGDKVYSKNFGQGPKWTPGRIAEPSGPVSFLVKLGNGQVIRRHQDHLRIRHNNLEEDGRSDQQEGVEVELETQESVYEDTAESVPMPETTPGRAEVELADTAESADTTPQADRSTPEVTPPVQQPPVVHTPARPTVHTAAKVYPSRNRAQPPWIDGPRKKPSWIEHPTT